MCQCLHSDPLSPPAPDDNFRKVKFSTQFSDPLFLHGTALQTFPLPICPHLCAPMPHFFMTDQQKVPHATLHFPLFLPPGLPRSDTVLQEKSAQLSASHIEDSDPHMRKHSSWLTTRKMSHFLTTYNNRNVIMSHSPLSLAHDSPPYDPPVPTEL